MHLGDCLEKLKELEPNSVESIVTDPPYGLKFMGKKWDYDVPSVEIWKEALRVLKPGGHLLSFGGTRTYHRLVVNIENAGFEIRDQIQWLYGSGFPKSHNIKDGEFKGWGTALKPANEPICMARKPLEKTVAQNVSKWGTGSLNIDGCRISCDDHPGVHKREGDVYSPTLKGKEKTKDSGIFHVPSGRWPANIILDEEAAEMLDEQSGQLHGRQNKIVKESIDTGMFGNGIVRKNKSSIESIDLDKGGGASRFFYVAKASKRERNAGLEGMPKIKCQSGMGGEMPIDDEGKERDRFVTHQQNHHPTVKPIKLMEYLIKLVTPPNGIVLDPFMGSGSTGLAAKNLGFKFIGIELNEEYFEIAKRRIA